MHLTRLGRLAPASRNIHRNSMEPGVIKIHLINESKTVTSAQTKDLATGLTVYGGIVAQAWGLDQVHVSTGTFPGSWEFHIVDEFPAGAPSGALGYHDLVGDKVVAYISTELTMGHNATIAPPSPFGTIIPAIPAVGTLPAQPEQLLPQSLAEVLTHELAEALVDPFVNRYAFDEAAQQMWMVEVGDHADAYRFKLTFGLRRVSMICQDFTLPSFYDNEGVAPFSHTGQVSARFTVDKGCYAYKIAAGAASSVGNDK